jgi:Leucine-rich repeat (LRR) protein
VVGVDRTVVDKLVKEHYKRLGLDEDKSGNYLAKMFQVEVQIEPTEQQISDFLNERLKEIKYWQENLAEYEQDIFRDLIFRLAERNPREVKRLINSSMMTGAGAMMMKASEGKQGGIEFNQGLQLFFVRKILDDRYTMGLLVGSERGNEFFRQWSEIVCAGKEKDKNFPLTVKVPADFGKEMPEEGREAEAVPPVGGKQVRTRVREDRFDISFIPEKYRQAYRPLLQNLKFTGLLHLVADEDLGELMRIPYPVEAAEIAAVVGESKDADIIREAIARQRGKKPDELTKDDYSNITELDLSGSEISDLEPLRGLSSLQQLWLEGTGVSDLEPLRGLSSLQGLWLGGTGVSDLEPIKGLTSLQWLDLHGTGVSDLEPIKGLSSLQRLYLEGTGVSNLEPIKGLTSLQWLYLGGTGISDLEPIKGLTGLQWLWLRGTKVTYLEPIKGLSSLQVLDLEGTGVSDLEPIKGLSSLQWLWLGGTGVSDLEPIKALTSLRELYLSDTAVSDLEPIKGLTSLQQLYLKGTQVADEEVAKLKKALPNCQILR